MDGLSEIKSGLYRLPDGSTVFIGWDGANRELRIRFTPQWRVTTFKRDNSGSLLVSVAYRDKKELRKIGGDNGRLGLP